MALYGARAIIVAPSACRERSANPYRGRPRAPAEASLPRTAADRVLPRTEAAARRADALARSLSGARDRLTPPLACIAASLVRERAWRTFGFARAADFALEHFGRSGRWLRDLAALHHALSAIDGLASALTGDDGGGPFGRRRALLIARVATPATLSGWLALARRLTVRELQAAVSQARRAGGAAPADDAGTVPADHGAPAPRDDAGAAAHKPEALADRDAGELGEVEDRSLVRLAAPLAVVAAFDEAVDLYRAVEGGEATVTSFVEALVGEASAGGDPPEVERRRAGGGPTPAVIEAALARSTDRWRHLPRSTDASWGLALGRSTLARLAVIAREAGDGTPAQRVARMKELLGIENEVEIHLGRLLASMGKVDAWNRLRFGGMGHYAEERLGLSRTAAQSRARAARLLGRFPLVREAYESDALGLEATLIVGRILSAAEAAGAGALSADAERRWVGHAAEVTIKRLRDEARALDRSRAFGRRPGRGVPGDGATRSPLSDADWHVSIHRAPGTARRRVAALGLIALGVRPLAPAVPPVPPGSLPKAPSHLPGAPGDSPEGPAGIGRSAFCPATALIPEPDVLLRLTLPDDLAGRFLAAIETARARLADQVETIPWDADWPGPQDAATPTLLAARTFSIRCRRVPAWAGLLALIEDFVATWDPDERADDVPDDPVLVRDGWRCAAPACSSRRNLEVHHVVYRSRGGGDEEWNRVCLCRFHHQRGEHGGLARCTGRAPLGLTWRLGAGEIGSWYRNERRIGSPASSRAASPTSSPAAGFQG